MMSMGWQDVNSLTLGHGAEGLKEPKVGSQQPTFCWQSAVLSDRPGIRFDCKALRVRLSAHSQSRSEVAEVPPIERPALVRRRGATRALAEWIPHNAVHAGAGRRQRGA